MKDNVLERIDNAINDIEKIRLLFRQKYGEECIADKEIAEVLKIAKSEHEELLQYRSIGTVSECREAMEKQRAKKPKYEYLKSLPNCPNCGEVNLQRENEYGNVVENYSHCPDCGQAIDWSDAS